MASSSSPSSSNPSSKSILFVCLGNICRSPMAEAVFLDVIARRGVASEWTVDSCGTIDYHNGKSPDGRTRKVLMERGVTNYQHKARVITKEDFSKFHYIMGMDQENVMDLKRVMPEGSRARILRFGEFEKGMSRSEADVRDPYYDRDDKGFYICYDQCLKACEGFLDGLETMED